MKAYLQPLGSPRLTPQFPISKLYFKMINDGIPQVQTSHTLPNQKIEIGKRESTLLAFEGALHSRDLNSHNSNPKIVVFVTLIFKPESISKHLRISIKLLMFEVSESPKKISVIR